MSRRTLEIDSALLTEELEQLAAFSDSPEPAVTRVLYTPTDLQARAWLRGRCIAAGLTVRQDAVGSLFARWEGDPDLAVVATGSHLDAIPNSGRYDGTVGVLGGLEAIRALMRSGFRPRRSLELIVFTSEEPTRFGLGCLGSRLMSGALSAARAKGLLDADGRRFDAVRQSAGFTGPLEEARIEKGRYAAFVELHIEQGPRLEREACQIGIVTAIAAPATLRIEIAGEGGHAGTVLMPERRDALTAAAEIVLAVESAAHATQSIDTVATTGVFQVSPGAVNSIPSAVRMEIDIRDIDPARRDGVVRAVREAADRIATRRHLRATVASVNADPPAAAAPEVIGAIAEACRSAGFSAQRMVSRAYHDSLFMARVAPMGMVFIPCRGGISHRPEEYCSPGQIADGVTVLAGTLALLSGRRDEQEAAR